MEVIMVRTRFLTNKGGRGEGGQFHSQKLAAYQETLLGKIIKGLQNPIKVVNTLLRLRKFGEKSKMVYEIPKGPLESNL